ncbi:MAG: hypothetical protein K2Q06_07480 [Parvularculaceae bacterium]|nr:hypothetical protein [Parvularculaceae bacterium]
MSDVEIDYEFLTQRAALSVVREVLTMTAELGTTPGEHHFYIEFVTGAPGVSIPDDLRATYPERMTIVLQHIFENLHVEEDRFSVRLRFKGKPADLVITFGAITSFADPSVQLGMTFNPDITSRDETETAPPPPQTAPTPTPAPSPPPAGGAAVVSLDQFRKK